MPSLSKNTTLQPQFSLLLSFQNLATVRQSSVFIKITGVFPLLSYSFSNATRSLDNSRPDVTLTPFLALLHARTSSSTVFNPWRDTDSLNDSSPTAPQQRLSHLTRYLEERLNRARWILIAEAPGYQGAKFSGCAMTSERRLLEDTGIMPPKSGNPAPTHRFFSGDKFRTSRTLLSNGRQNPAGALEPTATMVWNTMLGLGHSHDFVLWNAFAWHPHHPLNPLTNRTPTDTELESGKDTLKAFLSLFPQGHLIAIGRKSQATLASLGISAHPVRHPANGGGSLFHQQMRGLLAASANP